MLEYNTFKIIKKLDPFCTGVPKKTYNLMIEAYNQKDWDNLFILFDTHVWFALFIEIQDQFTDIEYFLNLGSVLTTSSCFSLYKDEFIYLLNHPERNVAERIHLMEEEDQDFFNSLSDTGTIFRGSRPRDRYGFSWTLDKKIAIQFSKRYPYKTILQKGNFDKNDVIAYFDNEKEILIDTNNIKNLEIINEYENDTEYREVAVAREKMHFSTKEGMKKLPTYKKLLEKIQDQSK